ncbi:hypothetical protein HYW21_01535 [Candidatus Woesearchaeota archaeon]|nr:hypothetical protein [Candidatus Woesearchaeota archaeon]
MINHEMDVNKTQVGLYTVTYALSQRPLDVQELAFAAKGLHTISPAEKGLLMIGVDDSPFTPYSRTDMDVIYDKRAKDRVVLARGKPISQLFLSDLVDAHKHGREFVVPKEMRDDVYDAIDTMLNNGMAFATTHGTHETPANRLGEEGITNFMYSDPSLGIKAGDFGAWLAERRDVHNAFFDSQEYARQLGPYINRLRLFSPGGDFLAGGGCGRDLYSGDGAFGVRFEKTAEGGEKSSPKK